jgi:hypothetical protein
VISAVFALVYTVGAWSAWRANPMYSARLTVRLLAVIVFGVGAAFAAIIAATVLTENSPAPVAAAAIGGVCFVVCLALIGLILQFSLPRVPPLAAGTALVSTNRRKLLPWVKRFGWVIAGLGLLGLALPGDTKFVLLGVGALTIALGIVALFAGFLVLLHLDRSMTSVEGSPWVHWRYTPDEWAAWSAVEVARIAAEAPPWQWKRDWKGISISLVIVTIPFAVNFNPADWKWLTALTILSWLVLIAVVFGVDAYARTAPARMRRLLSLGAPDTYLGAAGVYADGVYTEWAGMGNFLLAATVDEREPRSLTFVFERSASGGGTTQVRQSVLVPSDADADLRKLQAALSAAVPRATISLA